MRVSTDILSILSSPTNNFTVTAIRGVDVTYFYINKEQFKTLIDRNLIDEEETFNNVSTYELTDFLELSSAFSLKVALRYVNENTLDFEIVGVVSTDPNFTKQDLCNFVMYFRYCEEFVANADHAYCIF